jgi:hypothetical protein
LHLARRASLGLAVGAALIAVALATAGSPSAAGAQELSAGVQPRTVQSGSPAVISGGAPDQQAGTVVDLYASPYPYHSSELSDSQPLAADGAFHFSVRPDEDTRYTVKLGDTPDATTVSVSVLPRTLTTVQALPLGRAGVTIVVFHPRDLLWGGAMIHWSFASPAGAPFRPTPTDTVDRLSPYVAVLHTTIALPAGSFRFRACFQAPGDDAMADATQPPGCSGRGYYGAGDLPVGFPGPTAVAKAAAYLASRTGRKAFAVIDTEGRLSGVHMHWRFNTASVVKAMLLTAYLRRLDRLGQHYVDARSNAFLYPMIHVSDNDAATECWSIVGDAGLYSVARAAGMTEFSVSGDWGKALLSPADQARFFFIMDSLIPREFVSYARFLLSTIEPSQTWGIPPVARPLGYQTFFKDGSEPTALGQLVHQVDRLEGHGQTFAIAVMTNGDPTMLYGEQTISGVAEALLG